jgi:ATP-dependent Clp protease ATP-binding subunit ClpC
MRAPSTELLAVLDESRDIADSLQHPLSSAHLLLCLFTNRNQASLFLRQQNITGDRLLEGLHTRPTERHDMWDRIMRRAGEVAELHEADGITSLHVLVALCSFTESAAYQLMRAQLIDIARIRSTALQHLQGHTPDAVQVAAPPQDAAAHQRVATSLRPPPDLAPAPRPQEPGPATARPARRPAPPVAPARTRRPPADAPASAPAQPPAEALPPAQAQPPTQAPPPAQAQPPAPSQPPAQAQPPAPSQPPAQAQPPAPSQPPAAPEPPAASAPPPPPDAPQARPRAPIIRAGRPVTPLASPSQRLHATLSESHHPLLYKLARNLTLAALEGQLDPVIGRDREVDQVVDVLNRRRSNNPLLVGEPGVGKTAVVEALALRMVGPQPPAGMEGRLLLSLEASAVVGNTALRGAFAERLQQLRREVARSEGRIILFLDELHHWMGMGGGDGAADGAGELKTALARGELPCIGATTWEEYRRHIEPDAAFERRFQVVRVNEPSPEVAEAILEGVVDAYARHHQVRYDDDALRQAVRLTHRYLPALRLPDKALGALDTAGSRARRLGLETVDTPLLATVVAEAAGLPVDQVLRRDAEHILDLETRLMQRIVGHGHAIERVALALRRNHAGFAAGRPIGSFLFLGPTGVGKTEFARALARELFGSEDAMTRIDMSELGEAHSGARLVGAPPGYVGHEAGGQLTESVRRRPWQLVLLDELEKAHPDVLNLLIQVLEDGRLTDGRGRTVDFRHVVVVMTSNLGADALMRAPARSAGFATQTVPAAPPDSTERALQEARASLRPELWNRFDDVLVFQPLSADDMARIARLQLSRSSERLHQERGIRFTCGPDVIAWLLHHGGWDPTLGARPLRRTIERHVEGLLADAILAGQLHAPDTVELQVVDDRIALVPPPTRP